MLFLSILIGNDQFWKLAVSDLPRYIKWHRANSSKAFWLCLWLCYTVLMFMHLLIITIPIRFLCFSSVIATWFPTRNTRVCQQSCWAVALRTEEELGSPESREKRAESTGTVSLQPLCCRKSRIYLWLSLLQTLKCVSGFFHFPFSVAFACHCLGRINRAV